MTKQQIEWVDVTDPQPGDIALHVSGTLDPREVTKVDGDSIWIHVLTDSIGPLPKENYTYRRPKVTPAGPKHPGVTVQLSGEDGNAFVIVGRVGAALRRAGVPQDEITAFKHEATSGDYDHLLRTAMAWVTVR